MCNFQSTAVFYWSRWYLFQEYFKRSREEKKAEKQSTEESEPSAVKGRSIASLIIVLFRSFLPFSIAIQVKLFQVKHNLQFIGTAGTLYIYVSFYIILTGVLLTTALFLNRHFLHFKRKFNQSFTILLFYLLFIIYIPFLASKRRKSHSENFTKGNSKRESRKRNEERCTESGDWFYCIGWHAQQGKYISIVGPIDWLDWSVDWRMDWLTNLLTHGLTDWLTNGLFDWLTDTWLTDWLANGLTDGLTDYLTNWLTDWIKGESF